MKHLEVLVISKSTTAPKILNWKLFTANTIESALEKIQLKPYQVVAIGKDITKAERLKLERLITILPKNTLIVTCNNISNLSKLVKKAYWSKINQKLLMAT